MRLRVSHETLYRYDKAPRLIVQALHLWPSSSAMQSVKSWQVKVDAEPLAPSCVDGFGNWAATHTVDRMVDRVRINVWGEVVTHDVAGMHGDQQDTLPASFYLRTTVLTQATVEITAFARQHAGTGGSLERLHRLCGAIRDRLDYQPHTTDVATTAAEAFAHRTGVCQDHAHVMIAAACSAAASPKHWT